MNDDEHGTSVYHKRIQNDWNQIFSAEVSDRTIRIVPIKKTKPTFVSKVDYDSSKRNQL